LIGYGQLLLFEISHVVVLLLCHVFLRFCLSQLFALVLDHFLVLFWLLHNLET
jgi:hypothetical protein